MPEFVYILGYSFLALVLLVFFANFMPTGMFLSEKNDLVFYTADFDVKSPAISLFKQDFEVSNSFLENKFQTGEFTAKTYERAFLSVSVRETTGGEIKVYLNDELIYSGSPSIEYTAELPIEKIRTNNVIKVEVSSPGISVFSVNKYIAQVKVLATSYAEKSFSFDYSGRKELEVFGLFKNIHGKMRITLNSKEIFYDEPSSELRFKLEKGLVKGKNKITFSADIGSRALIEWFQVSEVQ